MATRNVLLRILGESAGADRELGKFGRQLDKFGRKRAVATADVDTDPAERALKEAREQLSRWARETASAEANVDVAEGMAQLAQMRAALERLDSETADPDVRVRIAKALADIAIVSAAVEKLDGQDAEIDVKVRRGAVNAVGRLVGAVGRLAPVTEVAEAATGGFAGRLADLGRGLDETRLNLGLLTVPLRLVVPVLGAVIGLAGALGAGAVALGTSLAGAAAGAGALGIGFGSILLPAAGLAAGVIANFKKQSGTAGTAAFKLKAAVSGLSTVFTRTLGPASNAVFEGARKGVHSLIRIVPQLKGEFTAFGRAVGSSATAIGRALESPAWVGFFQEITRFAADVTPTLTSAFLNFAGVLRNIASASLPYVRQALEGIAGTLGRWQEATANVARTRDVIGQLVGHLRSWLSLAGAIADAMVAVFEALGPQSKALVDDITKVVERFTAWLRTTEGQQRMRDFMESARELLGALGESARLLLSIWNRIGPTVMGVLTEIVQTLNDFLRLVDSAASRLEGMGQGARTAVGALLLVASVVGPFRLLRTAVMGAARALLLLSGAKAFTGLAGAARTAGAAVVSAFSGIGPKIGAALRTAGPAGATALRGLAVAGGWLAAVAVVGGLLAQGLANALGRVLPGELGRSMREFNLMNELGEAFNGNPTVLEQKIAAAKARMREAGRGLAFSTAQGYRSASNRVTGVTASVAGVAAARTRAAAPRHQEAGRQLAFSTGRGYQSARNRVTGIAASVAGRASQGVRRAGPRFQKEGRGTMDKVGQGQKAGGGRVAGVTRQVMQRALALAKGFGGRYLQAGRSLSTRLSSGIRAGQSRAVSGVRQIAQRGLAAAKSFAGRFQQTGRQLVERLASGARSVSSRVTQSVRQGVTQAANAAKSAGSSFRQAGLALMQNMAEGVRAGAGPLAAAVRSAVAQARAALPGSEPKDSRSPLRRLDKAGRAIMANIGAGVKAALGALVRPVNRNIAVVEGLIKRLVGISSKQATRLRASLGDLAGDLKRHLGDLKAFANGITSVASSLRSASDAAAKAFAHQLVDTSPEALELKGLTREEVEFERGGEEAEIQRRIDDARRRGNLEDEQAALADLAALKRKHRIEDLTASIAAKHEEVDKAAEVQQLGQNKEVAIFQGGLNERLNRLLRMLRKGEIAYVDFAARVQRILAPLGVRFAPSEGVANSLARRPGRGRGGALDDRVDRARPRVRRVRARGDDHRGGSGGGRGGRGRGGGRLTERPLSSYDTFAERRRGRRYGRFGHEDETRFRGHWVPRDDLRRAGASAAPIAPARSVRSAAPAAPASTDLSPATIAALEASFRAALAELPEGGTTFNLPDHQGPFDVGHVLAQADMRLRRRGGVRGRRR